MTGTVGRAVVKMVKGGVDSTLRQLGVAITIAEAPSGDNSTIRGLAGILSLSKPTIVRAVDRLVKSGYAMRKPDPKDARSVHVVLTPKGRKFVQSLEAATPS